MISELKSEPQWMRDFRLKSLQHFLDRPMPTWGSPMLAEVDFERLATDTFIEACVEETAAVLCAQRARAGCIEPAAREALDVIVEETDRLNNVVTRFLDYARTERSEPSHARSGQIAPIERRSRIRGRVHRDDQVLRLGAGWGRPTA